MPAVSASLSLSGWCIWMMIAAPREAAYYRQRRMDMVRTQIEARGVKHPAVLRAMRTVPRHEFVSTRLRDEAYEDHPLPIGYGQTISQPYIVAVMTELLDPSPEDVVLEVGTGSGYQAAVLAQVVRQVYSLEIIEGLAAAARERLARLGYHNLEVKHGDGYYGWPEHAPYDGIIVTAAASHIPPPLLQQLKPGGRMVIPVGPPMLVQSLVVVRKESDGTIRQQEIMSVRFVPLVKGTGKQR
ncbi:MAG TPA: protein-L-isoaspartate(D-aspartate) O-methyltransferase [Kiritimatiellae bacterium]|nr:protein-L-isoaspartate(D-aspartate) O-methyltransferase [Kiritimatiellia bacterium]